MCEAHFKFTPRYELLRLGAERSSEWGECWCIHCFFSFFFSSDWFEVRNSRYICFDENECSSIERLEGVDLKISDVFGWKCDRKGQSWDERRWMEWTCVFATSESLRGFLSRIVYVPTLLCYWRFPLIRSFSRLSLFFPLFFITKVHVVHMTSTSQWEKKVIKHIEICFIRSALQFGIIPKQKQTERMNE